MPRWVGTKRDRLEGSSRGLILYSLNNTSNIWNCIPCQVFCKSIKYPTLDFQSLFIYDDTELDKLQEVNFCYESTAVIFEGNVNVNFFDISYLKKLHLFLNCEFVFKSHLINF
jgi:hypothetical protein